jgi:glycopeptide antibiotics resistance protein
LESTTYILYNIVPYGFTILLIFIFIDIFLDRFRNKLQSPVRRILLYSFYFYILSLIQIKLGGISFPLKKKDDTSSIFISFNEWFGIYDLMNMKISMGFSQALIYNFLFFIPLGIYLSFLFSLKSTKKVISTLILICLIYLICYFILDWIGLVFKSFTILDISYLFVNGIGGLTGFLIYKLIKMRKSKMDI